LSRADANPTVGAGGKLGGCPVGLVQRSAGVPGVGRVHRVVRGSWSGFGVAAWGVLWVHRGSRALPATGLGCRHSTAPS